MPGFSVLAFEYRRLGESGGTQRGLIRIGEQLDDWQAAIGFAKTLSEVDPQKLAAWGFSISGGHMYHVAARNPDLGAVISHAGSADGFDALRYALRFATPKALLKLNALALIDGVGTRLGREPILIPLSGRKGEVAAIHTPDSQTGSQALNPGGKYDEIWPQFVAASSALRVGFYRPGRVAHRINIPFLVLEFRNDGVTPPGPAAAAAHRAPRGELVRLEGGHYAALMEQTDPAVNAMVEFLSRHLLGREANTKPNPLKAPAGV